MNLNATLLGQMIAFGLFVWFCWKFVWPPLLAAMDERAEKIEQGLKDSEESAKKILDAEEQSKKMLTEAKKEAKKIMDNAKNQSEKIVEESKNKATEEKDRIVGSAQSEIEKEVVNAKKTLEKDFASSVMSAVKKIVARAGVLYVWFFLLFSKAILRSRPAGVHRLRLEISFILCTAAGEQAAIQRPPSLAKHF